MSDLLLAGQSPLQIMQSTLRESTVMELRDCTIDELLYFIDQGTPVFARTGGDRAILLTGYSANYVTYYDPVARESKTVSYDVIAAILAEGGNYFIAYVK